MFDFNKLGEMSKIAGEARKLQQKQEAAAAEQISILKKISGQLDKVISLLQEDRD